MKNLQIGKWLAEYGERIALGVALVIMLLLSLWGLLSSGPDLTPDKARQVADDLKRKLRTQPASEQMLRQYLPVRVEEIERNTEGVINAIPAGAINLDKRIGRPGELGGLFRRNPKVLEPVATKGAPVFVVHSRYEVVCERDRKTNQVVCSTWVVQPKPGVKAPELKATPTKPNDPRQQWLQQRLKNLGHFLPGMGPMAGPGGVPGAGGPMLPPMGAGGAEGSGPGGSAAVAGVQNVNVETQYELKLVPVTESAKYPLAEFLNCREAVLLVAAFPYAEQMQEIADALLLERHQAPSLFKGIEVQKRVFALGDNLRGIPDELIIWDPQTNDLRRVAYIPDLPNREELGWLPVNVQAAALQVASAVDFEQEADPLWQVLLSFSRRLVMRLPKMHGSGTYPWKELAQSIPEIRETIKKIEENQKLFQKPPEEDPRLKPNVNEAFEDVSPVRPAVGPMGEGSDAGPHPGGFGSAPGGPAKPPQLLKPNLGGGSAPAGPKMPAESNQPAAAPAPVIVTEWPDYCLIRFLDIFDRRADMRFYPHASGGRPIGVQYRIRVVLQNPNFRETRVQRPEMALPETLEGPWSPPSEIMPLHYATYLYAEPRDTKVTGRLDQTPVQIHRWLGIILANIPDPQPNDKPRKKRVEFAVGDWVVGSTWVGRGEFIGLYAELPLAVWAPHVPVYANHLEGGAQRGDRAGAIERFGRFVVQPDADTDAFKTGSILLDFDNNYTWNDYARQKLNNSLNVTTDLVPQEVLIFTEDGRIIARNAQRDASDAERKKREETWKKRLEELQKTSAPGGPSKPFNPFGGS
jgi:hypothetical protein